MAVVVGGLAAYGTACVPLKASAPGPKSVSGPEDPSLCDGLEGTVALCDPFGGANTIELVSFPGLERKTIPLSEHGVRCISAPDDRGRIAYVQQEFFSDSMFDRGVEPRLWLKAVSATTGEERVLLEKREYHPFAHVALSQNTGLLAVALGREGDDSMETEMRVWDLESNESRPIDTYPCQMSPTWFPDGRRLAFEALLEASACPASILVSDPGRPRRDDGRIRVICILDTNSWIVRPLQVGKNPVPATDGASVFVRWNYDVLRVDADTGEILSRRIRTPGKYFSEGTIIAHLPLDRVLYAAQPTTGEPLVPIPDSSAHQWTLKVSDLGSGSFCTVLSGVFHVEARYSPLVLDLASGPK